MAEGPKLSQECSPSIAVTSGRTHELYGFSFVQIAKIELFSYDRRDHVNVAHQLPKLFGVKALRTVRKGRVRVMVYLDHQTICARGNGGTGHRTHLFADAGGVARIDDHGQMGQVLDHRNGRKVQGVTRIGFKGANPSLTKHNMVISFRKDIFCRHKPFFDGGCKPSL